MTTDKFPPQGPHDDDDDAFGPASLYDTDPAQADDLWFAPDDDLSDPEPERKTLVDPADWRRAESEQAAELARAAADLGRLDMLVERLGDGAVTRLALIETEAMAWSEGLRMRREDISRDLMGRTTDPRLRPDLARTRWALRRLSQRPGALGGLRDFLGLHEADPDGIASVPDDLRLRVAGGAFAEAETDFTLGLRDLAFSHPLTQAAFAYRLWPLCNLSAPDAVTEPATAAARIAGAENRGLAFAPCAAMRQVWTTGGSAEDRLRRYIAAVRAGALSAIMELHRLEDWAVSARAATANVKGSTPGKLIDALMARPLLSTEDAALATDISRDSAERMLARLLTQGVVREITGQTRFRLWTAAT